MSGSSLQAVIFDVDGTLVDSERDGHRVAFNLAFEELGLPYRWDPDEYGGLLATAGGRQRLQGYLEGKGHGREELDELVPALHGRKTELFQDLVADGRVLPRPGAPELVDDLERAGVRLAVATTGSRGWVVPLLDRLFGGADRFEVVVTGDEAPVRKPDPSAYVMTVEALGSPGGTVAVEDAAKGLEAALAAGLPCAVVVNDYTADEDFTGAGVVLDGFGTAAEPARVVSDPHGLAGAGRLDVEVLRGLAG